MNTKKTIYRRALILCLMAALVILTAVSVTLAWFANGKESKLANLGMTGMEMPFELEVRGAIVGNKSVFAKADATYQNGEEQSLTPIAYQTSGTYNKIIWRKMGEGAQDGQYEQGIGPNSHGKLTFWIVPKNDGELNVSLEFGVRGFLGTFSDQNGNSTLEDLFEITDDMTVTAENGLEDEQDLEKKKQACSYLKGHLLFFADYDDATGYYSGFLGTGNSVSFADCIVPESEPKAKYGENGIVNVEKGGKYQVTIYWKWADTLEQILMDANSHHKDEPLFAPDNQEDRDRAYAYLKDTRNRVFQGLTQDEIMDYLDNVKNHPEEAEAALSELSTAYNNADLLIGYNMHYIMIEMTAENGLD